MTDKPAAEKLSDISAALDDYKQLILKVAAALVEETNTEAVKAAVEEFKASSPDQVSKSLADKDAKADELQKSLDTKTTELESVQKSLDETTSELEKVKARKAIVFDKFSPQEPEQTDQQSVQKAAQSQFAGFIMHGAR